MSVLAILSAAAFCLHHVHDGDTITLCGGERIRLVDIDAPELRGSPACSRRRIAQGNAGWCDYRLGLRARNALRTFLASGPVRIERRSQDHYHRTLARVTVNGQSAGTYLISQGLARPWR